MKEWTDDKLPTKGCEKPDTGSGPVDDKDPHGGINKGNEIL